METVEKLAFLRIVPLFRYASEDILLELAESLIELEVEKGKEIIKKDEFGSEMYIIVEGKVKVHDGNHTFAILEPRNIFGELAALAPEVRIASVTALEDSILIKIEHDNLYEIMGKSLGFVKGIIEVLCQRTRLIAAKHQHR